MWLVITFRKTTVFVFDCFNWLDDIDAINLDYRFYALEDNTKEIITIQDFSSSKSTYMTFDVKNSQLVKSNFQVFCDARDRMNAIGTTSINVYF